MSIVFIPNQPVVFDYPLNDCDSCDPRDYCLPVINNEEVCYQMKQTPCGVNLNCDENFEHQGEELVTNGDFDGTAVGWTYGVDWAYGANNIVHTAGAATNLTQTIASLIVGQYYVIQFTVSGYAGAGGFTAYVANGGTSLVTANGTYTFVVLAVSGTTLGFVPDATATFTLDNIHVYEVIPCWSGNAYWSRAATLGLTHIAGSVASIVMVNPPLTSGQYYRVSFTVENITAGSVQAMCGTTVGTAIDEDGTYVQYITANGTDFGFKPTTDFNGTITWCEVKLLKNDWTFKLYQTDDTLVTTITDADSYYNQWVTFCFDLSEYVEDPSIDCYYLTISELCSEYSDNIVLNSSFREGSGVVIPDWNNVSSGATWGYNNVYFLSVAGGQLRQFYTSVGTKVYYRIKVFGDFLATNSVRLVYGGTELVVIVAPGEYDGIVSGIAGTYLQLNIEVAADAGASLQDRIYVEYMELYEITEVDNTYTSNCIKIIPDAGCTRVVEGSCLENNMGFNFTDTGYVIHQRIGMVTVNPAYPTTGTEYIFSDGEKSIVTAQREKYWTLRTQFIPEWAHDCLSAQKICDIFTIDGIEYVAKIGEYVPDYLGGNDYVRLSSVSFDVRKKSEMIFNNYCNND